MKLNSSVTHSLSAFLLILLLFVGCGEAGESVVNSQPSIVAIPNQTVDVGKTVEVEINITDADAGDTHTVNASSNNTDVATVSVSKSTLSIKAIAEGTAIIEVAAKDDSGQDNAAAIPVTFNVTTVTINFCQVGDVLQPGERCFNGNGQAFTVLENGSGHYGFVTSGGGIYIFAQNNTFSATKQDDGTWIILAVMPKE